MRIELVGGLGVGKSTLCDALGKIGFHCLYETLDTNPFLADCYADPANFRFSSQMWFVLSKFHEILKSGPEHRIKVLDQSVLNVRAYTNLLFRNEDTKAHDIIDQCFAYLEEKTGPPDLLINLACSPREQLRRIKMRSRSFELGIGLDYVTDLQNEINALLEQVKSSCRIIEIDTEEIYLPGNFAFAEQLAKQIARISGLSEDKVIDPDFPRQYSLAG
ncbi:MAG: deoxyadenosine kinase [Micavibrio aeruginosavorus]|uniref:Deoxyadenosine kinase n=1 Tax=Micavibrio aeruginosavorus TaxID=349221 RepID=A0A2W5FF61_9BACT|nr:MAG: deoxyadenosine kinase [Micavibrio aeruginosavorus]